METPGLFKGVFPIVERALDLRALKHNVTVANIANRDTPNYKAFDLAVEEELQKEMGKDSRLELRKTSKRHLPGRRAAQGPVRLEEVQSPKVALRRDGNTVDIDREMAKLAENHLMYDALAQIVSRKFKGLKNVIQGGK